jgi:hypothetical protein
MASCAAITKDGAHCKASALVGSEYCYFHDPSPEAEEERRETQIRAGRRAWRLSAPSVAVGWAGA